MSDEQQQGTVLAMARARVLAAFDRQWAAGIETHGQPLPVSIEGMDMADERLYEQVDAIVYETAELMQRDQLRATLIEEQHINRQLTRTIIEVQGGRDRYRAALKAASALADWVGWWLSARREEEASKFTEMRARLDAYRAALAGSSDAGGAP